MNVLQHALTNVLMVFQNSTSISVLSTRVVIFSILLPQDMCQVYQVFFHLLCWFLFWTFQLVTAFMLKSGSNVIFTIQLGDHWMIMSSINVTLTLVLDAFFDIWPNFLMNFNWHLHLNVSSFMLQWQIWNLIKKTLENPYKKVLWHWNTWKRVNVLWRVLQLALLEKW